MPRFIIRPPGIMTTPRLLATELGARGTRHGARYRTPDWDRDFFLYYPNPSKVHSSDLRRMDHYQTVYAFSRLTKSGQRTVLRNGGLHTPNVPERNGGSGSFIVRPLRHSQGRGWRLTTDSGDFDPAREYIQEVFPKTHEYRVICVLGTPLITLVKRIPHGLSADQPWNHTNGSSFVTVEDQNNNRLRHTDVYERLKDNPIIKSAHYVGVDVMYNKRDRSYAVCEFNFAPALTIPNNIMKVKEHVALYYR